MSLFDPLLSWLGARHTKAAAGEPPFIEQTLRNSLKVEREQVEALRAKVVTRDAVIDGLETQIEALKRNNDRLRADRDKWRAAFNALERVTGRTVIYKGQSPGKTIISTDPINLDRQAQDEIEGRKPFTVPSGTREMLVKEISGGPAQPVAGGFCQCKGFEHSHRRRLVPRYS